MNETYTTMVYHCARCGQDHEMTFRKFTRRAIEDDDGVLWQWWGLCPITSEPVLMSDTKDEANDE